MPASNKLKTLIFTDNNTSYSAQTNYVALGKIDRKLGICESRKSEDEGLANKYGIWRKCLEEAAKNWSDSEKDKSLIFCHEPGEHEKISAFIESFEKLLELKENGIGSLVFPTSKSTITAIRVSPFWVKCPMRRRLFLILMRAGRQFNLGEKPFDCMMRDSLLRYCNFALEAFFLKKLTNFAPACIEKSAEKVTYGFCFQFANKSKEQIENKMLFASEAAALSFGGSAEEEPEEYDEDEDDGLPTAW